MFGHSLGTVLGTISISIGVRYRMATLAKWSPHEAFGVFCDSRTPLRAARSEESEDRVALTQLVGPNSQAATISFVAIRLTCSRDRC